METTNKQFKQPNPLLDTDLSYSDYLLKWDKMKNGHSEYCRRVFWGECVAKCRGSIH